MADSLKEMALIGRDGTSQAARPLDALDPGYVSIDERRVEDLLTFVRQYARELRYFDLDEPAVWVTGARFWAPPMVICPCPMLPRSWLTRRSSRPSDRPELFRPHLVLFLTFLKLFQAAQSQLNTIGRRHLEFYYGQVLGMAKKSATPDSCEPVARSRSGR